MNIEKLRALPIEPLAEKLEMRVQRHTALCPFHNDHRPSLRFNVAKNTYRCYSCGAHGGVIDLAIHVLGKGFLETCRWLEKQAEETNFSVEREVLLNKSEKRDSDAPKTPVDIEHLKRLMQYPMLLTEAKRFLYDERKINPAVVRWLGLSSTAIPTPTAGYRGCMKFNAPSLLIPYRDVDGNLTNVQARYLGTLVANRPRFQFPQGSRPTIFNLPVLKMLKREEDLYIAEGSSDCMALLSAGHKAIAIPSATLLSSDDMALLGQYLNADWGGTLHVYPDHDEPGEKLFTQLVSLANALRCPIVRHNLPDGCKDFGAFWGRSFNSH